MKKNKKEKSKKKLAASFSEKKAAKKVFKEVLKEEGENMLGKEKENINKEDKEKLLEIEKEEEKKKGEEKIEGKDETKEPKIKLPASAPFIANFFNKFMAKKFGEVWILKPDELVGLSKATDEMVLLYGEWLLKYSVQFNFAFWLFMVLSPRWQSLKKPEPEKKDIGKEK